MSNGYELDWDSQIENDNPDFVVLPEGDYGFEVIDYERVRYNGGEKIPPCWKAVVHIKIEGPEGISIIRHQLFLHSSMEGMLCAFFVGIGQRKKKEKVGMNWNAVPGSRGRAKVGIRKYDGKEYNEIKRFYEPEEGPQNANKGFQPGRF